MFKVLRGGYRVSLAATTTAAFVPGLAAKIVASDTVALCDDAALAVGIFFDDSVTEVTPVAGSLATVVMGDFEGSTDQVIVSGLTFGGSLGIDATTGKFKVAAAGDRVVGIAINTPSATVPLHFWWFGGATLIAS